MADNKFSRFWQTFGLFGTLLSLVIVLLYLLGFGAAIFTVIKVILFFV